MRSLDSIINAALEEICARGAAGIAIADLWPCLATALSSSGLPCSDSIRNAIWTRLLSLPVLRFSSDGCSIGSQDPKMQPFGEAERLGLRIFADEQLRDSFVGLDDLNAANAKIPGEQRRTLERIAAARTSGITQCELAKEFGIKLNNFFYQVRNLECQQLIVRQSTTVREKEVGHKEESGLKSNPINTNLLRLYRYAKSVNLNSQQKIEITKSGGPDTSDSIGNAGKSSVIGDVPQRECIKEDMLIKDYLPAMKAVCDKLEEANEKILVVSDIKLALGYRKTPGHRAWRNILKRLEDAGLVEKFQAEVNGRDVQCLRFLKRFDHNDFQSKPIVPTYDGFGSDNLVKHGKRGHVNEQFLELPMEYRIYDMIDAEGPKGITILEVCKRLGLSSKKMYTRITEMCSRFGMCMEFEKPNKTQLYRVWTHKNYKQYSTNVSSGNYKEVPIRNGLSAISSALVPYDQASPNDKLLDSSCQDDDLNFQKKETHSAQEDVELSTTCGAVTADPQVTMGGTVSKKVAHDILIADNDDMPWTTVGATNSSNVASESPLSVSYTTSKQTQWYRSVALTTLGARRVQWILNRLKDDKFILDGELFKWIKDLEKDKPTMMDRKTFERTLNKLQQDGLCKITQVTIPTLTNFSRNRIQGVILHPSIDNISSDLLNQIYKSYRDFEFQIRSREAVKSATHPVTVLTDVKRSSNHVDEKPVILEAMRKNGYVQAKMVRAKLLHNFLWDYISSLPIWQNTWPSSQENCNLKNHRKSYHFAMGAAIKAMPLELFLQIVGSAKAIDDMVQKCSLGLRLMDLSMPEYKILLDTHATGRLSRIINILLRLKLIQLVWQGLAEIDLLPHATPTHSMEHEPYIEEPLPRVPPSLKINSLDLHPRIRHDFVFSRKEDVNAYWETLEYCYTSAELASAKLSFPGSVVHEVFNYRSWTSIRVMTAEQRMELVKRMEIDDLDKKIPFEECVKIARELNLSVEQVLRVSYDKQQRRAQRSYNTSKSREQEKCMGIDFEPIAKRRRTTKDGTAGHVPDAATRETSCRSIVPSIPCGDGNNMERDSCMVTDTKIHDHPMETCRDKTHDNFSVESEPHEEDDQSLSFIKRTQNPIRHGRYTWTDELDRQIIMQYARRRVFMGDRSNRVAWSLVPNLPTDRSACRRRMIKLISDKSTRRAVMRLCNLLGKRYGRYLKNAWRIRGKNTLNFDANVESRQGTIAEETVDQDILGGHEDTQTSFQQNCWDDFEDPDIKMAVDEVLRYKKMASVEHAKGNGSQRGQGLPDTPPTEGTNLDFGVNVTPVEQNFISSSHGGINDSHGETGNKNSNILPAPAQSRSSSHHSRRKFMKLSSSRGIEIQRIVRESITVANAVELLKLVFLSNCAAPEVQASLAETLQLYPKCDLIAAFNYLKEKEFVVFGDGNRPPVLSKKFWHNASSSPFPIDSGKRAASFSTWLHEQDRFLEDGLDLITDIQCGETFHLFALISSGEVFISPTLPKEGIGEAEESKSSQSFLMMDDELYLKLRSDKEGIPCSGEKDKKQKCQGKVDSDFCSRREKGFPGIKVVINRATIPRIDALHCSTDGETHTSLSTYNAINRPNYSDMETVSFAPLLSSLSLSDNFGGDIQAEVAPGELPCDQMIKHAEHLASVYIGRTEVSTFCPELFVYVLSVIDQAGEQGLNIKEISRMMGIQGVQLAEVVVNTLEVFQLAFKVNAYDCVRVVSSSYRSKYSLHIHASCNQENFVASYMRFRGMSYRRAQQLFRDQHDVINNSENNTSMNLSAGHKLTLLDLPPDSSLHRVETELNGESVTSDNCNQVDDVSVKKNESENKMFSASHVSDVYLSILPWINGDGSTNTIIYKGLTRRVLGTVMQNPGILEEDITRQMDVLNPQSCRRLLETMILDNHLTTRMMHEAASADPPSILQTLFHSDISKPKSEFRKHYFANPMSTSLL